jgi:hypothetical protein
LVCRPAVITTTSPRRPKPPVSARSLASRTTSSKSPRCVPSSGNTPRQRASWLTTRRLGLIATIGSATRQTEGGLGSSARSLAGPHSHGVTGR